MPGLKETSLYENRGGSRKSLTHKSFRSTVFKCPLAIVSDDALRLKTWADILAQLESPTVDAPSEEQLDFLRHEA